jgi:hypothetical protein
MARGTSVNFKAVKNLRHEDAHNRREGGGRKPRYGFVLGQLSYPLLTLSVIIDGGFLSTLDRHGTKERCFKTTRFREIRPNETFGCHCT